MQYAAHVHRDVFAPHADADGPVASDGSLRSAPHRWNKDALHPPEPVRIHLHIPEVLAFEWHHGVQGDSWAPQSLLNVQGEKNLYVQRLVETNDFIWLVPLSTTNSMQGALPFSSAWHFCMTTPRLHILSHQQGRDQGEDLLKKRDIIANVLLEPGLGLVKLREQFRLIATHWPILMAWVLSVTSISASRRKEGLT